MNIDKKKLGIILFALLLIASGLTVLFLKLSPKKVATPNQTNSSSSIYYPSENTSPAKDSLSPKNTGTSVGQNLRDNTTYIYSEPNSKESLKKVVDESLNRKNYPKDINWESYATKDSKQVPLSNFSNALGIKINSGFSGLLDEYNYDHIVCKNNSNGLDYGLVLNYKLFDNYPELEQKGTIILKSWEPSMLKDLYRVLFPGVNFTEQDLNQNLIFRDGTYRYATVSLPGNTSGTINYHTLVDSIVFTSSLECMKRASQEIEAIE